MQGAFISLSLGCGLLLVTSAWDYFRQHVELQGGDAAPLPAVPGAAHAGGAAGGRRAAAPELDGEVEMGDDAPGRGSGTEDEEDASYDDVVTGDDGKPLYARKGSSFSLDGPQVSYRMVAMYILWVVDMRVCQ